MKLSIVITVFNKEAYLNRAFDSLLNQDCHSDKDYEILAVNDGSTDNSSSIIEEYAKRDSRVKVLNQENQGLSMARNNGLVAAQGDYVWFVDADDTFSSHSVKFICDAIESSPDVIPIYAQTDGIDIIRNRIPVEVSSGKEVIISECWQQCGVFWVLRKQFILDNGLRFMPGIYHEDAEFTPRMLYAANSVKVVPEVLYIVYRDPNSITQVLRAKRAFDYLTVSDSLSRFVKDKGECGTRVGRAIDDYTAQDINNAFYVIVNNSKEAQHNLNKAFYDKRESLLRPLMMSSKMKYRIEGCLFLIFPKFYVEIYKIMKLFGRH